MHKLLNDFIEYESLKGYTEKTLYVKVRELERFISSAGKDPVLATQADIVVYLESQEYINSYNRKLSYIYQFFDYLLDCGIIFKNPTVAIERLRSQKDSHAGIFTEDEIKAIIAVNSNTSLGKRNKAILELLYSTGMRVSELTALNIHDIDYRNNEVVIINGKFGRERIVPVGDEALKAMEIYVRIRSGFLFYEREHEALFLSIHENRISESAVRGMIARKKKAAGITTYGSTHAFRHSCASHMLKNGATLPMIQRLLGHEDLHATELYTHIYKDAAKEVKL